VARRRAVRILGNVLIVAGLLGIAWTIVVWQWQDPFTGLYTRWQQHHLRSQYAKLAHAYRPPYADGSGANLAALVAREAARYRRDTHPGEGIGKIVIGRLGLHMILVDGTDETSLEKGPGRDLRTYMPGQNRLVYVAGHRTTYLAPFAHIEDIRPGDYVTLQVPYATFLYRAFRHEIVPATDLAMLNSPNHELLRLQACHPRFFATHRYIVDARLVHVTLPDGQDYSVSAR
jgi:sortase A